VNFHCECMVCPRIVSAGSMPGKNIIEENSSKIYYFFLLLLMRFTSLGVKTA
jgi:hypothetical protein